MQVSSVHSIPMKGSVVNNAAAANPQEKKDVKEKNAAKQRENFGNIAATFQKPEKEYIAAIFAAHGVKPAEVIRGAAAALRDGQTIRTEDKALPIPADAAGTEQLATEDHADAAQPPTTGENAE